MMLVANTAPNVHETVKFLLDDRFGSLLDVAAGTGAFLSILDSAKFKRFACELNLEKFQLLDVPCVSVDLNGKRLPYLDDEFDIVTAIEIIEHLENPWKFVTELHRIIKPGGILILTTPNVTNWYSRLRYLFSLKFANFFDGGIYLDKGYDHITPIFPATLQMMIKNKFEIKKITYNRMHIPLINLNFLKANSFFGEISIFKLEKK